METGLRAFLLADATINGLVGGTRIHPVVLPQGSRMPAVTYQRISGNRGHTTTGPIGLSAPRVQIDAWASDYDQARSLADAVLSRLDAFRGDMGGTAIQGAFFANERDGYEGEPQLYRVSRDFFIWFEED